MNATRTTDRVVRHRYMRCCCVIAAATITVVLSSCSLAQKAATGAAGVAAEVAECAVLDLATKGLAHTDHMSPVAIGALAGVSRVIADTVKQFPADSLPPNSYALLDDAAKQIDMASNAAVDNPTGAQEVVDRAAKQINGVVVAMRDKLDC